PDASKASVAGTMRRTGRPALIAASQPAVAALAATDEFGRLQTDALCLFRQTLPGATAHLFAQRRDRVFGFAAGPRAWKPGRANRGGPSRRPAQRGASRLPGADQCTGARLSRAAGPRPRSRAPACRRLRRAAWAVRARGRGRDRAHHRVDAHRTEEAGRGLQNVPAHADPRALPSPRLRIVRA